MKPLFRQNLPLPPLTLPPRPEIEKYQKNNVKRVVIPVNGGLRGGLGMTPKTSNPPPFLIYVAYYIN